jgi:predicted RNA-binding Zn-ribbon protein involved in translation (DUF1610 family)
MDVLWILIIAVLGLLTVFLLLVIVLATIMMKYGLVYTPPRFVLVVLNLLTGELREISPGLRPIIPGVHKIIRMVNCQPHVMGVETIKVVSSDGQPYAATYQQTWWVDAFEKEKEEKEELTRTAKKMDLKNLKKFKLKDIALQLLSGAKKMGVELKKGRTIKSATCISDERQANETEEQAFERHASENVKLETQATITSIIGSYNTDTLKSQKEYSIYCPECGEEIKKDDTKCLKTGCKWAADNINISKDFKARLGWLTTVLLDKSLSDRFGIGCDTKVSNIVPPEELQKALLNQQVFEVKQDIAEKKGEAVKRMLAKEAEGYQKVRDIGVNANVAYIVGKLSDSLSDLLEHLLKSAIPKEGHSKGGETK